MDNVGDDVHNSDVDDAGGDDVHNVDVDDVGDDSDGDVHDGAVRYLSIEPIMMMLMLMLLMIMMVVMVMVLTIRDMKKKHTEYRNKTDPIHYL